MRPRELSFSGHDVRQSLVAAPVSQACLHGGDEPGPGPRGLTTEEQFLSSGFVRYGGDYDRGGHAVRLSRQVGSR